MTFSFFSLTMHLCIFSFHQSIAEVHCLSLFWCVFFWSWAVSRVDSEGVSMKFIHSVICTEKDSNDVSVRNHFLMSELKVLNIWTVIAVMLTSVCTSFVTFLKLCLNWWSWVKKLLLLEWLRWVDNVLHNVSDMTLIELFDDDDYGSWLFEQMSEGVFCIRLMFKKTSVFTRQLLHKLVHLWFL
jgi:hypothetical protein